MHVMNNTNFSSRLSNLMSLQNALNRPAGLSMKNTSQSFDVRYIFHLQGRITRPKPNRHRRPVAKASGLEIILSFYVYDMVFIMNDLYVRT
jgi:hypothetical protein